MQRNVTSWWSSYLPKAQTQKSQGKQIDQTGFVKLLNRLRWHLGVSQKAKEQHLKGSTLRAAHDKQDLVIIGSHAVIEVSNGLGVSREGLPHLRGWAGEGALLALGPPLLTLQEVFLYT